jgi:hypothetical protein
VWVRCQANLTTGLQGTEHPALPVNQLGAWQVFLNGVQVGASGDLRNGDYSQDFIRTLAFDRRDLLSGTNTIALSLVYRDFSQRLAPPQIIAGDLSLLQAQRDSIVLHGLMPYLIPAACYLAIGVMGFILLGLYLNERRRLGVCRK